MNKPCIVCKNPTTEDNRIAFRLQQPKRTLYWHFLCWWNTLGNACYFCGNPITIMRTGRKKHSLLFHHLDDDHTNDSPENLAICHFGCHSAFTNREHFTENNPSTKRKGKTYRDIYGEKKAEELTKLRREHLLLNPIHTKSRGLLALSKEERRKVSKKIWATRKRRYGENGGNLHGQHGRFVGRSV